MARSNATTVEEYLDELPPERREVIAAVRQMILENLPEGVEETINWGMISYEIPLSRYPTTYNKQPLAFVALAAQKNHYALYMSGCYGPEQKRAVEEAFAAAGKKLDMGKSCIRFKRLSDLPLDALGQIIGGTSVDDCIALYEASRAGAKG